MVHLGGSRFPEPTSRILVAWYSLPLGETFRDDPNGSSGSSLLTISVTQTEVVNSSLPHYSRIALSAGMERGELSHLNVWRTDLTSRKMRAILKLHAIFLCYNMRTISSNENGWWCLLDVVKLCLWLLKTRDAGWRRWIWPTIHPYYNS